MDPEPQYRATPGYNYQTMPYLKTEAHNEVHLKVSRNPDVPYQGVANANSPAVQQGVQMRRLPLIAAGYDTLTGDNRCYLQNIDADYYTLNNAYEF